MEEDCLKQILLDPFFRTYENLCKCGCQILRRVALGVFDSLLKESIDSLKPASVGYLF